MKGINLADVLFVALFCLHFKLFRRQVMLHQGPYNVRMLQYFILMLNTYNVQML
jgi:hypothetical protein